MLVYLQFYYSLLRGVKKAIISSNPKNLLAETMFQRPNKNDNGEQKTEIEQPLKPNRIMDFSPTQNINIELNPKKIKESESTSESPKKIEIDTSDFLRKQNAVPSNSSSVEEQAAQKLIKTLPQFDLLELKNKQNKSSKDPQDSIEDNNKIPITFNRSKRRWKRNENAIMNIFNSFGLFEKDSIMFIKFF